MWCRDGEQGRGWGSWEDLLADFRDACGPDDPNWTDEEFKDRVRDIAEQETGEQRGAGWLKEMTLDHLDSLVDQMWFDGEKQMLKGGE